MIKRSALVAAALGSFLAFSGCESKPTPEELQPSLNKLNPHNRGLQAKNVKEMADTMYRSMAAKVAAFNERNPNAITVVVYPVRSKDGRDYGMITKQIAVAFSKANNANVNFTADVDVINAIQAREFGGVNSAGANRLMPHYVLRADLDTLPSHATTTYYFHFFLTKVQPDGTAGLEVWQDAYEFQSMN